VYVLFFVAFIFGYGSAKFFKSVSIWQKYHKNRLRFARVTIKYTLLRFVCPAVYYKSCIQWCGSQFSSVGLETSQLLSLDFYSLSLGLGSRSHEGLVLVSSWTQVLIVLLLTWDVWLRCKEHMWSWWLLWVLCDVIICYDVNITK